MPSRCWFQEVPGVFNLKIPGPEEIEEIVSWLLDNFDLELETIEKINGMAEGIDAGSASTLACILISLKRGRTICC